MALHKAYFLTGGPEGDVGGAEDDWGNPIYTKLYHCPEAPDHRDPNLGKLQPFKQGEIDEATSAISRFIQIVNSRAEELGVSRNQIETGTLLDTFEPPELFSEIADVVFI